VGKFACCGHSWWAAVACWAGAASALSLKKDLDLCVELLEVFFARKNIAARDRCPSLIHIRLGPSEIVGMHCHEVGNGRSQCFVDGRELSSRDLGLKPFSAVRAEA
jgi:hypothetical protein